MKSLVILLHILACSAQMSQLMPKFQGFPFFPQFWDHTNPGKFWREKFGGPQKQDQKPPQFDSQQVQAPYQHKLHHFVFELNWPATFAVKGQIEVDASLNATWVISKMWPQRHGKDSDQPTYCRENYPFDRTELTEIEGYLEKYWPYMGDDGKTNEQGWKYAWEKYGTCALKSPNMENEFDYFNGALLVHYNCPVFHWLEMQGIVPDNNKLLKKSDIVKIIKGRTNMKPFVRCVRKHNKVFLKSIMICQDMNLNPIDCSHWNSESHEYLCGNKNFIYPEMPPI